MAAGEPLQQQRQHPTLRLDLNAAATASLLGESRSPAAACHPAAVTAAAAAAIHNFLSKWVNPIITAIYNYFEQQLHPDSEIRLSPTVQPLSKTRSIRLATVASTSATDWAAAASGQE